MIARHVGEHRDVERHSGDAVLHEAPCAKRPPYSLRAHADARSRAAALCSRHRVGCRIAERARASPVHPLPSVPTRPAFAPQRRERLRDPVTARSLAVGPRDADHPEARAGPPVDFARDHSSVRSQIYDAHISGAPRRTPGEVTALPQNGSSAARNGVGNEFAPVARLTRIRDEGVAGLDLPAVARKARDPQRVDRIPIDAARGTCGRRWVLNPEFGIRLRRSPSSLISGAVTGGSSTLLIGASGGTASSRNAPLITWLNTGRQPRRRNTGPRTARRA